MAMRMRQGVSFMALGGGQSVGASCYLLRLGARNILLDCGTGMMDGVRFSPDFRAPLEAGLVDSLSEIPHVFISHAHMDHVGALPMFIQENPYAAVYMTEMTRYLSEVQLSAPGKCAHGNDTWLTHVTPVSYLQELEMPGYRVSFLSAGHIPGAMMTQFMYEGRRILYTGDYSFHATAMTSGCSIPNAPVDILLLCGVHANHPGVRRSEGRLASLLNDMRQAFSRRHPVCCQVNQLSKGVELLALLQRSLPEIPVYVDAGIMRVVQQFERVGIPVMSERVHPWSGGRIREPVHLILTTGKKGAGFWQHTPLNVDFSLHDDFEETAEFIERICPRVCVVMHSPPGAVIGALENRLHNKGCQTQIVYARQDEWYELV